MKKYLLITFDLWKILKPFHNQLYFQLFGTFFNQGLSIATTVAVTFLLDKLIANDKKLAFYAFLLTLLISLLRTTVNYFVDKADMKYLNFSILQYLQEYSLRRLLHLNISQHIEQHSAYKLSLISKGELAVGDIIQNILFQILPVISFILISLSTLTYYNLTIAIITGVIMLVLCLWIVYFSGYLRPFLKQNNDNWDNNVKVRTDGFSHFPLVKYLGGEDYFIKKYLSHRGDLVNYSIFTWLKNVRHYTKRGFFLNIASSVTTGYAILLYFTSRITLGSIYLIFNLTSQIYSNITSLARVARQLPSRFIEVEKYLDSVRATPDFKEEGKKDIDFSRDIIFDTVTFKYPKSEKNILENISFTIPNKKKTAFVGQSGSGKSTVVKILLRAYEYNSGSIKVGEVELRDIDSVHLRKYTGYVEQHVDLLDDTVKENILFGTKDSERNVFENRLEEIAVKARIDQFYNRLGEKKFDTVVGERGIKLSGGERQRIGIARAIIKDPDVLIFDEATSSLDTKNEKFVMDAIKDVSMGKTTIIIAHRLSTVLDSDQIIVMDKGRVVGIGTHNDLLEKCGEYKTLIEHQILV